MARFYLHLQAGDERTEDEEGDELASAEDARLKAIAGVREILAAAIRHGLDPLIDAIVVADSDGKTLSTVPLSEALPKRFLTN